MTVTRIDTIDRAGMVEYLQRVIGSDPEINGEYICIEDIVDLLPAGDGEDIVAKDRAIRRSLLPGIIEDVVTEICNHYESERR